MFVFVFVITASGLVVGLLVLVLLVLVLLVLVLLVLVLLVLVLLMLVLVLLVAVNSPQLPCSPGGPGIRHGTGTRR